MPCRISVALLMIHFIGGWSTVTTTVVAQARQLVVDGAFQNVEPGDVPKGWEAPDAVAVQAIQRSRVLQATTNGTHEIKSPAFDIDGDFRLDLYALLADHYAGQYRSLMEVTLESMHGEGIKMRFVAEANPKRWEVTLGEARKVVNVNDTTPNRVRLVRKDRVYQLLVNDEIVIAQRMPRENVTALRIKLTGPSDASGSSAVLLHHVRLERLGN